jgi:hypothetical protein
VRFEARDAASLSPDRPYDLVTLFEALHDMAHPVAALRRARSLVAPGGSMIVADERVADAFEAPGEFAERFMHPRSVLHCLPATRAEEPSVEAGTVLRAGTLQGYAAEAGFSRSTVLPIENDFWRFYHLSP